MHNSRLLRRAVRVLLVAAFACAVLPAVAGAASPTARFTVSPAAPVVNQPVTFDASASADPDAGDSLTYAWDFDGDDIDDAPPLPGASVSHTYPTTGPRRVRLTVRDEDANAAVTTVDVVVHVSAPPVVRIVPRGTPRVMVGSPIAFDGSGSTDLDGTIVRYEWDVDGDGSFELDAGAVPRATRTIFEFPVGNTGFVRATVGLRVTDDSGEVVSDWLIFNVATYSLGNDVINGDARANTIVGNMGNDTLYGWDGEDVLSGGPGNDVLWGGNDSDHVDGGAGADRLFGEAGRDVLTGAHGRDALWGGGSSDMLRGGDGNDVLTGGDGADTLLGNRGRDVYSAGNGHDFVHARDGRAERVSCDRGVDIVVADPHDRLRKCEIVFYQPLPGAVVHADPTLRLQEAKELLRERRARARRAALRRGGR